MILQVENLNHTYVVGSRELAVLHHANLELAASKVIAVQGESGSGKTTLLLACGAMQKPTSGRVKINQQDVFEMSAAGRNQYRANKIGYLFQTLQLVPYLNVLDNIRIVKGVSADTAMIWLKRLGLQDRLKHKPESLSHGQRQRVALARAIAHNPSLIIADEPTGNLDPKNAQLVFETLRHFADEGGAVLIASHDPTVESFANEMLYLESGTLVKAQVGA